MRNRDSGSDLVIFDLAKAAELLQMVLRQQAELVEVLPIDRNNAVGDDPPE